MRKFLILTLSLTLTACTGADYEPPPAEEPGDSIAVFEPAGAEDTTSTAEPDTVVEGTTEGADPAEPAESEVSPVAVVEGVSLFPSTSGWPDSLPDLRAPTRIDIQADSPVSVNILLDDVPVGSVIVPTRAVFPYWFDAKPDGSKLDGITKTVVRSPGRIQFRFSGEVSIPVTCNESGEASYLILVSQIPQNRAGGAGIPTASGAVAKGRGSIVCG